MSRTFRPALGLALACAIATVATAQTSPTGCFTRTYDDAHLAKHPDQVVKSMQILFSPPEGEQTSGGARLRVEMADQGHAARDGFGGQVFDEGLYCAAGDYWYCGIDCDGGTIDVIRADGDTLVIRTSHLRLGESEGCGGTSNLAEKPEQPVDYLLRRASLDACPPPY